MSEPFVIETDSQAEWALKKIRELTQDRDRFLDHYNAEIKRVEIEYGREHGYFVGLLSRYFETRPVRPTATQAVYRLPGGKLIKKFAKQDYEHDDAVLTQALAGSEYVEEVTTQKLHWGEFRKRLRIVDGRAVNKETGEIVEGVTIVDKPGSFIVEVK